MTTYNALDVDLYSECQPRLDAIAPMAPQVVHLEDPADSVLCDFNQLAPLVISADVCIDMS